jgi:hypothetical protein
LVPIQEFITQAKAADEPEDVGMEFDVDGVLCTAYHPGDGQLAYLVATTSRHSSAQEQVAGLINFFVAVLDDESREHLVARLLDRKDPFGVTEVEEIFKWLTAEWTARPTKSLSGSTPSRRTGGRRSTARVLESTS